MSLASIFSGFDFLTEKLAIACSRSSLCYLHPHSGVLAELWGPRAVVWRLWLGEQDLESVNEGIDPIFTVYKVNQSPTIQDPQWRETKLIVWFSECPTPRDTVASHRAREFCVQAMGILRCAVMPIFSSMSSASLGAFLFLENTVAARSSVLCQELSVLRRL